MTSPKMFLQSLRALCLPLGIPLSLVLHGAVCQAREGNVFSLTASESLQYDDNIFRLAPDADTRRTLGSDRRDDFISATTIAVEANKRLGRHTFYGEFSRNFVVFQEFSNLNYTGQSARAGWGGVFGAANNWDAYYKRSSVQSDFADLRTPLRNVVTTDRLAAETSVRIARDWVFRPAASEDRYSNSAEERRGNDGKARDLSVNFGYRPYAGNVLELQLRQFNRDYKTGAGFRQVEIGGFGSWVPTGASTLDVRVALLEQTAKEGSVENGDFDQVVGYLNYRWRPTGASELNFKLFRESSSVSLGTDQDALVHGITAQWSWAPLAKMRFDTTYDYRRRKFSQSGSRDNTRALSLFTSYLPMPQLSVQAGYKKENRDAEAASRSFDDNNYSVTMQYRF